MYSCRPSELMGIHDEYEAFCFDEACGYIRMKLENPEDQDELKFRTKYNSFTEMYRNIERQGGM